MWCRSRLDAAKAVRAVSTQLETAQGQLADMQQRFTAKERELHLARTDLERSGAKANHHRCAKLAVRSLLQCMGTQSSPGPAGGHAAELHGHGDGLKLICWPTRHVHRDEPHRLCASALIYCAEGYAACLSFKLRVCRSQTSMARHEAANAASAAGDARKQLAAAEQRLREVQVRLQAVTHCLAAARSSIVTGPAASQLQLRLKLGADAAA